MKILLFLSVIANIVLLSYYLQERKRRQQSDKKNLNAIIKLDKRESLERIFNERGSSSLRNLSHSHKHLRAIMTKWAKEPTYILQNKELLFHLTCSYAIIQNTLANVLEIYTYTGATPGEVRALYNSVYADSLRNFDEVKTLHQITNTEIQARFFYFDLPTRHVIEQNFPRMSSDNQHSGDINQQQKDS